MSEWPLTTKKIYNSVRKNYGHSVSYQAVYKALAQLSSEKIIQHTAHGWQIRMDWVRALHNFTEIVETNYRTKSRVNPLSAVLESSGQGNTVTLTFGSLIDAERYVYYQEKHHVGHGIVCVQNWHEWRPIIYMKMEYERMRRLAKSGNKICMLCHGDTPLDRWCADFYRKLGAKVKTKVKCSDLCELVVFGDTVSQVYIPVKLRDTFDSVFNKMSGGISSLDAKVIFEQILTYKIPIQVVIRRDADLANQIRKSTLAHFK
jgi:hypothetical protein